MLRPRAVLVRLAVGAFGRQFEEGVCGKVSTP